MGPEFARLSSSGVWKTSHPPPRALWMQIKAAVRLCAYSRWSEQA
jgi:hypothetical protein